MGELGRLADALAMPKGKVSPVTQLVLAVSTFILGVCLAGLWDRRVHQTANSLRGGASGG
jgi:hypothetical protein